MTSGRAVRLTACASAALAGLAVAAVAGAHAHAMDTAAPTRAELSAAAAVGVAQRWERLPAGAIFPAAIGYTSDLSTRETASRVGIDPADSCANAVDGPRYANAIGKGIYYAVAHGAAVINMSLGSQQPTAYLRAAVGHALANGVVVVASAGNDGTASGFDPYVYPASFTGVIAVAAVTGNGTRAAFSEQNAAVVLSAPGVDVVGAGPAGEYLDAVGTSPAAALVSGVAALIKSRYPALSPALVQQALITSATRRPPGGYSAGTGFGEVDAVTALTAAARLAALRPSRGFAAGALFASLGASGTPGPAAAGQPIQVVRRDTAAIDGYTAAAGAGAVCFLGAVVLVPLLARRPSRR